MITLSPDIIEAAYSSVALRPSTTSEIRRHIIDGGIGEEYASELRVSEALHSLRAGGRIELRRHCQILPAHTPRRQIWHLPGVEA